MKHRLVDDSEVLGIIADEEKRIENSLNLIAAESHAPRSVMEALGSVFNTKTIEGYPGNRFHAGCVYADAIENLAIVRGKELFGAEYVNVQPHSGTSANMAVYFSVLEVGDRVLAMKLEHGGHLSHGHSASITSRCFRFEHYTLNSETELIDYDEVLAKAKVFKPKMIVAGASSYPRLIDYGKLSEIANEVSAYLMADMAHISGLVAAGAIPSPVPHCDFVTLTGYKTMMGGRGGVILAREQYGKRVDRAVFPGCQGTSPVNVIAAKAVIFKLAMSDEFKRIQKQTLRNAVSLANALGEKGYRIVSGGTENHQVLVDVTSKALTGDTAEKVLESVGIIANRNVIPRDACDPGRVSGVRLGTAALAARGMGESEMVTVAGLIDSALMNRDDSGQLEKISQSVLSLCRAYPVYS